MERYIEQNKARESTTTVVATTTSSRSVHTDDDDTKTIDWEWRTIEAYYVSTIGACLGIFSTCDK